MATAMVGKTDDTRVCRQWEKAGRRVKRGAKSFHILAPTTAQREPEREGDESKTVTIGFRTVSVFRVQYTEGDLLPEYEPATLASLAKIKYRNTIHG